MVLLQVAFMYITPKQQNGFHHLQQSLICPLIFI
jgi:hypothetical protein